MRMVRASALASACTLGALLGLSGCGGGGGGSGPSTPAISPPTTSNLALNLNVLGIAASTVSGSVTATDPQSLPLTYSIGVPPKFGTATIDSTTGAATYTLAGQATAPTDSFTVKVANSGASALATVSVALNSDPLLPNQWHLQNTGQNAFASVLPVSGNDMDVAPAWAAGFTGKGIKVGVVDSGIQANHEDLAANVDLSHSYNFLTGTSDPTRITPGFDHGTAVAGIIGAVAFNGVGGRGVAYNSTLRGYNLIATGAFTLANFAKAAGLDPVSSDNDLFNFSFGPVANALPAFSGAYQTIAINSLILRGGLGAAIVNAAGNDFVDFEVNSSPLCAVAKALGVSCGDPAQDERRGGYVPIIVGALNASGKHASYSSTGSAIWISAPGGEYGLNSSYFTATNSDYYGPAIITTSRSGCTNAQYSTPMNALNDLGLNPLAIQCQYTATMNGTSSATPNVSGTVALMLQANPKLTVRDIKYILATTAKHVDPGFSGVASTSIIPGATFTVEQGWIKNAGGFYFSNWYGFGGVDAGAAVTAARGYTHYLPALQNNVNNYAVQANSSNQTVQRLTTTGSYGNFNVSETFGTVESVVFFANIASTPALACNQIELTSPSGTKSILMHIGNGFTNSALVNTRFLSNAFYGEPVNGTWTVRFLDACPAGYSATLLSTTAPQTLLLTGH